MKIQNVFSQKAVGHFKPNFICKLLGIRELNRNAIMLVT